jgi:glutamyl-tRNA reductase
MEKANPPRGKRADQVLTSYLFDLYTTSDNEISAEIGRYSRLYNKKDRIKAEEEEFQRLKAKLNDQLASPETDLEKLVAKAVDDALNTLTRQSFSRMQDNPYNLEIKRQLKNLFDTND